MKRLGSKAYTFEKAAPCFPFASFELGCQDQDFVEEIVSIMSLTGLALPDRSSTATQRQRPLRRRSTPLCRQQTDSGSLRS